MGQTTVRITDAGHALLKRFAKEEKRSMQSVLEDALEEHRRARFLREVNAGYASLRSRSTPAEFLGERSDWERTISDGLPRAATRRSRRKRP